MAIVLFHSIFGDAALRDGGMGAAVISFDGEKEGHGLI